MPTHKIPAETNSPVKLFVLDTNVLMHDPTSLFRFEEHDVYLPMYVLEELDNNKKGMTEVARNARQASRFLDSLVSTASPNIDEGVPLQALGNKAATGRLFLQTQFINLDLPQTQPADNQSIQKKRSQFESICHFHHMLKSQLHFSNHNTNA